MTRPAERRTDELVLTSDDAPRTSVRTSETSTRHHSEPSDACAA